MVVVCERFQDWRQSDRSTCEGGKEREKLGAAVVVSHLQLAPAMPASPHELCLNSRLLHILSSSLLMWLQSSARQPEVFEFLHSHRVAFQNPATAFASVNFYVCILFEGQKEKGLGDEEQKTGLPHVSQKPKYLYHHHCLPKV